MSLIIDGTNGVTFNDSSLQGAAASPYVLKNRIINGDMRIAQRTTAAVTNTTGPYPVDRWVLEQSGSGVFTGQQSSDVPTGQGFTNSIVLTTTTIDSSVTGNDYYQLTYNIEGYNVADFMYGLAGAQYTTWSFWAKASQTGVYSFHLTNDGTNVYPSYFTISSANTWTKYTITVPGCTVGTWNKTNLTGLGLRIGLAYGSYYSGATANTWGVYSGYVNSFYTPTNQMIQTNGATFYITGVQLEIGTSATPFERRLYGQELINCQRYYYVALSGVNSWFGGNGYAYSTTQWNSIIQFPVTMRTTASLINNTGSAYYSIDYPSTRTTNAVLLFQPTNQSALIYTQSISSTLANAGYGAGLFGNNASSLIAFSAEL